MIPGVIVGHANMDLDCLGSMMLARQIHKGYVALRTSRLHPLAAKLLHIYGEDIGLLSLKDLAGELPGHIVVVDTRNPALIREYLDAWPDFSGKVTVYDHHMPGSAQDAHVTVQQAVPADTANTGATFWGENAHVELIQDATGSNTSLVWRRLMAVETAPVISAEEAIVAMAGVFADTGHFTHANVCSGDFEAAEWLLSQGAKLPLVHRFVSGIFDERSASAQHSLISSIQQLKCNGSTVLLASLELEQQIPGLALITERIFELEQADALFCVFGIGKDESHLIIARSRGPEIDVAHILAPFGGGGHPQSASALVRKSSGIPISEHLKRMIPARVGKARTVAEVMVKDVESLNDDWTIMQAAIFLEERNFSGAPVIGENGKLAGILTLRDIQKARKVGRMQSPVKAFMTRDPLCFTPDTDMHEVEQTFFRQDLNHIPVVEDGTLRGIISRGGLLSYLQSLE